MLSTVRDMPGGGPQVPPKPSRDRSQHSGVARPQPHQRPRIRWSGAGMCCITAALGQAPEHGPSLGGTCHEGRNVGGPQGA